MRAYRQWVHRLCTHGDDGVWMSASSDTMVCECLLVCARKHGIA